MWPWSGRKKYASSDEFFQDLKSFIERMDTSGHTDVANELREGLLLLNGLTDGWAMLMDSVKATIEKYEGSLDRADAAELKEFLCVIKKAVYR